MRIALLGTRGIPANYGGFETFAEELSTRLIRRGHDVTVYCRTNNVKTRLPIYRGVRLALLPTIPHKYFDTLAHTALSTLHLLFRRYDAVLYCNGANAIFTIFPRLLLMPTALNVDGLERNRKKWNALARAWYALSERLSCRLPTATISDAEVIERYYLERYGKRTHRISYGADFRKAETTEALERLGLEPGQYFLYVSRLEPENNALLTVEEFVRSKTSKKLAIVGDAPYAADYISRVKNAGDSRVLFPGAIYKVGYRELQTHCFAYIHATEVGGTHPALIEAMGRGAPTLYLDTPENAEVAGDAGLPFTKEIGSLAARIDELATTSTESLEEWGAKAESRARERYDWERVVDQYEKLFAAML